MKKNLNYVIGIMVIILFYIGMVWYYNNKVKEFSTNLFYMDTYINVKVYSNNEKKANEALEEVDKIFSKYHKLTDRYNDYEGINNIYLINNNDLKAKSLKLDQELYDLIKYGLDSYDKTNGLININLGRVIDVWKKYRDKGTGIPTIKELKNSGSTDIKDIKLLDDNYILNNHPCIDLGALAKGYTVEVVSNYLEQQGFDKYLINAGGNVSVGNHYANSKYKIGIEDPNIPGGVYQVITGNNIGITTSGSYERFYEYNGKKYHHIIDPNTYMPSEYMKSVTVITKDTALGDMLSTTLFLMSIEDGKEYIKKFDGVEAIWYGMNDEIVKSDGFSNYE